MGCVTWQWITSLLGLLGKPALDHRCCAIYSVEERRQEYMDTYDIVIEGDPDLTFVLELFALVADQPAQATN